MITISTPFVLADRVQIASTNRVDCFQLYLRTPFTGTVFLLEELLPLQYANHYLRVCNIEGRYFFFFPRVSWDKAIDDELAARGAWRHP